MLGAQIRARRELRFAPSPEFAPGRHPLQASEICVCVCVCVCVSGAEGHLQASVFQKMSPIVQGVVMAFPPRSADEDQHRRVVLSSLAPAKRGAFERFVESKAYQVCMPKEPCERAF